VTILDDRLKDTSGELAGTLNLGVGAPISNRPTEAQGYAEDWTVAARQNAIQVAERTETVRDSVRRTGVDGKRIHGAPLGDICGYDAFEVDFRGHHHTNAARRRGPYEHYRVVYRYGYDLGADTRYRSAEWSAVEQDARPRWEERNPGTWDEFKETIRYAWNKARGQR
jgi:hypothetical protein